MFDLFITGFLGTLLGSITAIIPGLGILTAHMMVWPYLMTLGWQELLLFYACCLTATQFYGSVITLKLGIPGELSSFPLLSSRPHLVKQGLIDSTVKTTVFGSAIGGIVGLLIMLSALVAVKYFPYFARAEILLAILLTACVIITFTANNRWYVNAIQIGLGAWLSTIGINELTGEIRFAFDNKWLTLGIPLLPLFVGLQILPVVLEIPLLRKIRNEVKIAIDVRKHISKIKWLDSIRHSFIGSICGLIPGATVVLASQISHALSLRKYQKDHVTACTAVETSNNSAAITALMPLLFLGIPITVSEAFILEFAEAKGFSVAGASSPEFITLIVTALFLAILFCTLTAFKLRTYISMFVDKFGALVLILIVIWMILLTISEAGKLYQIGYHSSVLAVCGTIGLLTRIKDWSPLFFTFLVFGIIEQSFGRILILY
jgi:putative tricarboxylic transport membrane protein